MLIFIFTGISKCIFITYFIHPFLIIGSKKLSGKLFLVRVCLTLARLFGLIVGFIYKKDMNQCTFYYSPILTIHKNLFISSDEYPVNPPNITNT